MYIVQTRGISHPNVVVGMSIFAGGLTQFIAAMWEFPRGNVFGATGACPAAVTFLHIHPFPVFASYGSFWMSYGTIFIPSSGILAAYSDPKELASALGIYLLTWDMVTLFFLCARTIPLCPMMLTMNCISASSSSAAASHTACSWPPFPLP